MEEHDAVAREAVASPALATREITDCSPPRALVSRARACRLRQTRNTGCSQPAYRVRSDDRAPTSAGAALGPAIGGLVAAEFGTRAPFALVAGGAALAAAHAHVFVRETLSRVREGDSEAERGRRGAEAEAGLDAGLDSREEGSEGSEGSERSERASAFVRRERVGEEGGTPRRSDHAMHNMDSRVVRYRCKKGKLFVKSNSSNRARM